MNAAEINQTTLIIIFYLTRPLCKYTEHKTYSVLGEKKGGGGSKLKTSEAIQASINVDTQVFGGNYMDRFLFL